MSEEILNIKFVGEVEKHPVLYKYGCWSSFAATNSLQRMFFSPRDMDEPKIFFLLSFF
jgi:hypothetical protein